MNKGLYYLHRCGSLGLFKKEQECRPRRALTSSQLDNTRSSSITTSCHFSATMVRY